MKKLLLLSFFLMTSGLAFSQSKYVYVVAWAKNNPAGSYISEVIDVTKLGSYGVSRNGQYGKLPLLQYYTKVATAWFKEKLSHDISSSYEQSLFFEVHIQKNTFGCTYGNEDACFFLNEQEANDDNYKLRGKYDFVLHNYN